MTLPIERPQLIQWLNETLMHHPIVVIHAPAGYGKTTLLQAWERQAPQLHLSLAIPPGTHTPSDYRALLLSSLGETGSPELQELADVLRQTAWKSTLPVLVNGLAQVGEIIVTVDGWERIEGILDPQEWVAVFDFLPPGTHALVICRSRPRTPMAKMRVRGQLRELGAPQLAMAPEEIEVWLSQIQTRKWRKSAKQLYTLTEGWPEAIRIWLEEDDPSEALAHYLDARVLPSVPSQLRTPLAQLARADGPVTAAMATEITGIKHSQALLEEIASQGLFLHPLDTSYTKWRFHPLFAAHLRNSMMARTAPAR